MNMWIVLNLNLLIKNRKTPFLLSYSVFDFTRESYTEWEGGIV
jgi:hypothetical protein